MSGWNNPAYRDMFTNLLMPNGSEIDKRFMNELTRISQSARGCRRVLVGWLENRR